MPTATIPWEPTEYRAVTPHGTCRVSWIGFEWVAVVTNGCASYRLGTHPTVADAQAAVQQFLTERAAA
jgi:hypothetical protein